MTDQQQPRKGRRPTPDIDKARNALIVAIKEKNEVTQEFELNFDFDGYSDEEIAAIKLNADCRLALARNIDNISNKMKALDEDSAELEDLRDERSDLQNELHEMAPLGMTLQDWEESGASFDLEPGRKRLEIEYRYNRAVQAFDDALALYREEERKAGVDEVSIEDIAKMKTTTSKSGRPKANPVFHKLDREQERYQRNYLAALDEAEDYVPDETARGRKPIHPLKKAESYKAKMETIIRKIIAEEDKLSNKELLERYITRKHLEIKRVDRELSKCDDADLKEYLEGQRKELVKAQDLMKEQSLSPDEHDVSWVKMTITGQSSPTPKEDDELLDDLADINIK